MAGSDWIIRAGTHSYSHAFSVAPIRLRVKIRARGGSGFCCDNVLCLTACRLGFVRLGFARLEFARLEFARLEFARLGLRNLVGLRKRMRQCFQH